MFKSDRFTSDQRGTKSRTAQVARHKYREAEHLHKQGFSGKVKRSGWGDCKNNLNRKM